MPAIHHVQIAIPAGGELAARRFYGELLGFRERSKPANLQPRGGVWFALDDRELHLGVDPAFRPAEKAHVAFAVRDLPALRGGWPPPATRPARTSRWPATTAAT
jgi:catechol 2,3-dioxygenase-like lactoylglutathione lyase family enzyme